jgi:PPOX class probable F420-dependent enzyme
VPESRFDQFDDHSYISLETFKKNGQGVQTPVWFVLHNGALYVYTEADSWKVKRIRNNPRVRVALCTMRGRVTGPWANGTAAIVEGEERQIADQLLNRKYLLKRLFNWLTRLTGRARATIRIQPAS